MDVNSGEFPVTFGYGDELELNVFLANRDKTNPYPLVWMLYPYDEDHQKTRLIADGVTFVLAVETNQSMENHERVKLTFEKILYPLLYNVRLALRQSGIITIGSENESFKGVKHPNFSKTAAREESAVIAIWDALKVSVDLEVTEGCVKPIKF